MTDKKRIPIEVTKRDVPLCCPLPSQPVWNEHPRVYLPIVEAGGKVTCPYCSTEYILQDLK